jgi:biotin operon repressor
MKLLAEGSSTPKIAKTLGTNRSAIWRRVQLLKQRLIQ